MWKHLVVKKKKLVKIIKIAGIWAQHLTAKRLYLTQHGYGYLKLCGILVQVARKRKRNFFVSSFALSYFAMTLTAVIKGNDAFRLFIWNGYWV